MPVSSNIYRQMTSDARIGNAVLVSLHPRKVCANTQTNNVATLLPCSSPKTILEHKNTYAGLVVSLQGTHHNCDFACPPRSLHTSVYIPLLSPLLQSICLLHRQELFLSLYSALSARLLLILHLCTRTPTQRHVLQHLKAPLSCLSASDQRSLVAECASCLLRCQGGRMERCNTFTFVSQNPPSGQAQAFG